MFDEFINLFEKTEPLKEPEYYDNLVFQINKYMSMEDTLLPAAAEFSKYLWILRGRYYYLLYKFIPKTNKRLYIRYVKNKKLDDVIRNRVRCIQQALNCNGKEGYMALILLESQGIDVGKVFGIRDNVDEKDTAGEA